MNNAQKRSKAAAAMGRVKSEKKTAAARENGKRGGRPKLVIPLLVEAELNPQRCADMQTNAPAPAPTTAPADRLLDQTEAAAYLHLTNPKTLSAWRTRRVGPPYSKIGACVRYSMAELNEWVASRTVIHGEVQS